jgi:hypothetical protein
VWTEDATQGFRTALTALICRLLDDGVSRGRAFYLHGWAWTVLLAIICTVPYGDRSGGLPTSEWQLLGADEMPAKVLLACETPDKGATSGVPGGRSPPGTAQRWNDPATLHVAGHAGARVLSTGVRTPLRRPAWVGIVELRI